MLNSVYEIGKLWVNQVNLNKITILLDTNKLNKNTKDVLVVKLVQDSSNNFIFDKIYQEDFDSNKNEQYLYKSGSSRGTDITPSCLITDPKKTFNNKFLKWFEKNAKKDIFIEKIGNVIINNKEDIFNDLKDAYDKLDINKTNTLLTLSIEKEGIESYIGDIDIFKEILIDASQEKYYKTGSKKVKDNSTCFLCNEEKEVFGLVSNAVGFSFSTPEKKGNVPGVLIENQWKLLPICGDCALYLEAGKTFIETYLNFKEFGLTYYVIPKFLINPEENFNKLFKKLKNFQDEEKLTSKDVVNLEDKLSRLVKGLDDIVEFKFLFYEASNNAFNILAYVESIIPSWLTKLYKIQKKIVDSDFLYFNNLKLIFGEKIDEVDVIQIFNKNEKLYPCAENNWYWKFLRDIFSNFSKKIYLDLVTDVLTQKSINIEFLIARIMKIARENWRNEIRNNYLIIKSLMLFSLFDNLNILKGEIIMNCNDLNLDNMLDSPAKKSSFLVGVLVKKLMNIQYNELGSTPFYNKLYGLEIDEKKLKLIYRKAYDKLRQYGVGYGKLESEISYNLGISDNNWNLNKDETSFFFLLGLTLYKIYDEIKKEGVKNE